MQRDTLVVGKTEAGELITLSDLENRAGDIFDISPNFMREWRSENQVGYFTFLERVLRALLKGGNFQPIN